MKIFIIVVLSVFILIALLLIMALFVKKDYSIKRQVTINQPLKKVFEYVKYLQNQDRFSKWATMDPNMKKDYRGIDGTVGFVSAWDSDDKKVGKGEQQIKKITDGERIDFEIHFIKPFEGMAQAYMTTANVGVNQTEVVWGFHSRMNYPMNLMLLFMNMDKMVGNDLQTGLDNLKHLLEE